MQLFLCPLGVTVWSLIVLAADSNLLLWSSIYYFVVIRLKRIESKQCNRHSRSEKITAMSKWVFGKSIFATPVPTFHSLSKGSTYFSSAFFWCFEHSRPFTTPLKSGHRDSLWLLERLGQQKSVWKYEFWGFVTSWKSAFYIFDFSPSSPPPPSV